MTIINIRESLNKIDKDTDCKYDLVNLYESLPLTDEEQKDIVKMLYSNEEPEVIYAKIKEKYPQVKFAEDDDISDLEDNYGDDLKYTLVSTKTVYDSDGFTTDYTWYKDNQAGNNVFVFGDMDYYKPEDGYFDYETENDIVAQEWFNSYNGFEDDLDESNNKINESTWAEKTYKFSTSAEKKLNLIDEFDLWDDMRDEIDDNPPTADVITRVYADRYSTVSPTYSDETKDEIAKGRKELFKIINKYYEMAKAEQPVTDESINEASYGGAYDIADDEYFTKDDSIEAADKILSIIKQNFADKKFPDIQLALSDVDLTTRIFRVTLTNEEGNEFTEEVQIDMRKIRHPLDLIKKYAPILAEKLIKQLNDYYSDKSINEAVEEDELEVADQKISSAKTSINAKQLPAIFRLAKFKPNTINLDMGGGKFDNAAEELSKVNVTNLVYDPYNRTQEHNNEVVSQIRKNGGADTATISNVLNVIAEPEARQTVLRNTKKLLKPNGTVYITVYEGDKSGEGRETSSGYQLNKPTKDYVEEIEKVFPNVQRRGKLIIAN